jgi:starvation-inducible DNA-binding protein
VVEHPGVSPRRFFWGERGLIATARDELHGWVRQAIAQSNEFADAATANIFTRVSRGIDKWLWMVQAHLQEG